MEYFLPGEIDSGHAQVDQFVRSWYSKHLLAMNEPSLLSVPHTKGETYRFLWLRTFHHPVAVRLELIADNPWIHRVELDGAGGYEPGSVLLSDDVQLELATWSGFIAKLNESAFWELPSSESTTGIDGAQWVFEGRQGDRRKFLHRWSPRSGLLRDLGLYFLALSGLPSAEVY
jgi:hypothetical protein